VTGINLEGRAGKLWTNGLVTVELNNATMTNTTSITVTGGAGYDTRNLSFLGTLQIGSIGAATFRVYGADTVRIGAGGIAAGGIFESYTNIGAITFTAGGLPTIPRRWRARLWPRQQRYGGSIASLTVTSGAISGTVQAKGDIGAITLSDGMLTSAGLIETTTGNFTGAILFVDPVIASLESRLEARSAPRRAASSATARSSTMTTRSCASRATRAGRASSQVRTSSGRSTSTRHDGLHH